jgi:hypothetical protein
MRLVRAGPNGVGAGLTERTIPTIDPEKGQNLAGIRIRVADRTGRILLTDYSEDLTFVETVLTATGRYLGSWQISSQC